MQERQLYWSFPFTEVPAMVLPASTPKVSGSRSGVGSCCIAPTTDSLRWAKIPAAICRQSYQTFSPSSMKLTQNELMIVPDKKAGRSFKNVTKRTPLAIRKCKKRENKLCPFLNVSRPFQAKAGWRG